MLFAGPQNIADLHQTDGPFFFGDAIFPFLGSEAGIEILQLLGGEEENIVGQDFLYVVVTDGHIFFCFAQSFVDGAHGLFQEIQAPLLPGNDFFPVPLIHVDGMDVVRLFIPADCAHVRIEPFSVGKSVLFQCKPFPLGQRMHNFRLIIILFFDAEHDRALHAV